MGDLGDDSKSGNNGNILNDIQQEFTEETDESCMLRCFTHFDKDEDSALSIPEFGYLCRSLFVNEEGAPYALEAKKLAEIFSLFDKNKNSLIELEEFRNCWNVWIKPILFPVSALLVVDVQNDFISGSLAISKCPAQHDGEEVVPVINELLETVPFNYVFYTLDWHPEDHISFIENVKKRPFHETSPISSDDAKVYDTVFFEGSPPYEQKLWPAHCVQESWGSENHADLHIPEYALKLRKGMNPDIDSYSAFWDNHKLSQTKLHSELQARHVTDVFCCGIAYDICVGYTAKDAQDYGYRTSLIHDASRGIDPSGIHDMQKMISTKHGVIIPSKQVKAMVTGKDRHPHHGYVSAMEVKKKEEEQ